jgi:hypothetical protein
MKVASAVVGVSFLLALLTWLLLTWLLLNGLNMNSDRYDRQAQALADFTRFERGMNREVLTLRAGSRETMTPWCGLRMPITMRWRGCARRPVRTGRKLRRSRCWPCAPPAGGTDRAVQEQERAAAEFFCLFRPVQRQPLLVGRQADGCGHFCARGGHAAADAPHRRRRRARGTGADRWSYTSADVARGNRFDPQHPRARSTKVWPSRPARPLLRR